MEITENLIEQFYHRANEYCNAKYGSAPDELVLEDGYLEANYIVESCGDRDITTYIISPEFLTSDLDELSAIRERKEVEEARKRDSERRRLIKLHNKRELESRRAQYEKLKKEFEPK